MPFTNENVLFSRFNQSKSIWIYVLDAIMDFSGGILTVYGPNETASIFATYPSEYLTLGTSFLDQVSLSRYFSTVYLSLVSWCGWCLSSSGGGHRHAHVMHPKSGREEEHPGSSRADPRYRGGRRAGHLHVHVGQLRGGHKPCPWSRTSTSYADCRVGLGGLHVSTTQRDWERSRPLSGVGHIVCLRLRLLRVHGSRSAWVQPDCSNAIWKKNVQLSAC